MPILPREIDLFPATLFEDRAPTDGANWWAVHTLSRREKELRVGSWRCGFRFIARSFPRKESHLPVAFASRTYRSFRDTFSCGRTTTCGLES